VVLAADHVIGHLTFGFWVHLLTKRFNVILWKHWLARYYPFAPSATRPEMHQRVDRVRIFRNRIAHHDAVFDKRPVAEHNNLFGVMGCLCRDTSG
jgi:hypothetical protein